MTYYLIYFNYVQLNYFYFTAEETEAQRVKRVVHNDTAITSQGTASSKVQTIISEYVLNVYNHPAYVVDLWAPLRSSIASMT